MDTIKQQASKVSDLVFSSETAATYQRTLSLTWAILRETGLLLWLVVCLVFVGAEWFYRTAVKLGRNTRTWYENLSNQPAASEDSQSFNTTGKALLDSVQSGTHYLLSQAKQQLGIKETAPTPAITPTKPASKPVASSPAPTPTASAPTSMVSSTPTTKSQDSDIAADD